MGRGRWIFVDPEKCRLCGKRERHREALAWDCGADTAHEWSRRD